MEDYISDYCVNYGSLDCIPEVSKWRYAKELEDEEPIPIKPLPRELNEVCKECNNLLLKEEPDLCPFCGDNRLSLMAQSSGRWPESEEGIQPFRDVYFCKNCQSELSVDIRPKK